ncbi:LLM class flavin-dependent oxidoreductase [Curtobacterium sp. A7_M15]|uniref:LLM class flavin-dependent oxidoreductase n=1 Tax=Curtobacterium sp. A7_M15 TaxID=3065241 RepID=UPI002737860D|nr:LLM class flavin-dependent oxidoreductase [Curtobacterium sp. A7_M15]MDP4334897.1 LLM class flavin-dependent oxidoreductase [Curtobacterium sp. A7_M15]
MTHVERAARVASVPLRVAVFSHGTVAPPAARAYRDELELFTGAGRLGYDGAWVRQFHFRHRDAPDRGGLPSPFVFFAALAERTSTLRLGVGAVTLPHEDPVRVAEDAAVLDALSGGRVELGVANGGGPETFDVFAPDLVDADREHRRAAFDGRLARLLGALRGESLGSGTALLQPDGAALLDRVWDATLTAESAEVAAARGHGVLVGTTQTVPAEVTAAAYLAALPDGVTPRVALSTAIYPARDRETALREARDGIEAKYAWGETFLPPATTLAEKAASLNLHYGTADDIAESIASKPYSRFATQLNVQVDDGYRDVGARADALALFAEQVVPRIGGVLAHEAVAA